jgi:polar amino acid transport system permease protein
MSAALLLESLPAVAAGFGVTLLMWLPGLALALALGLALALLRQYGGRALDAALGLVLAVVRGTPFLIQLFLLYYGGPLVGVELDATAAGLLGLAAYGGAYYAEIMRGGFQAVPRGHVEAATMAGLSPAQTLRRILLPEMALLILPAAVNMAVVLMKETAVLSIITVPELTMVITGIGSSNFAFTEAAFLLAVAYWVLTEATGAAGRAIERRMARARLA